MFKTKEINSQEKIINNWSISARISKKQWKYYILLNINSNKFSIELKQENSTIEEFEIVSAKWYLNISLQTIILLREISECLINKSENCAM